MDGQSSSESDTTNSVEVVRDSTFARFVADEAIVVEMGRDLEIGFLQYGPLFTLQVDLGRAERTDLKNVVTEVARMRMSQNDFMSTIMRFLKSGILEGRLKGDAIQQSILEWVTTASETQASTESEEP